LEIPKNDSDAPVVKHVQFFPEGHPAVLPHTEAQTKHIHYISNLPLGSQAQVLVQEDRFPQGTKRL